MHPEHQLPPIDGGARRTAVPAWQPVLLGALAGGMGWGIRGQFGHETGAMIAGLLLSLSLTHLLCPQAASLPIARAVAWCTVAIGFGGSMTYGQTLGLTQDAPLIGNWSAFRWGMVGLLIKGGVWIGFAGIFLGMGLGGKRYRPLELLLLMVGLLGLFILGTWLLNAPFDPATKTLPKLYFSDSWHWEPDASLQPRREVWGGLLLSLIGLLAYTALRKSDLLARNLGAWAILGGALGFPLGQSLQAFHAWNRDLFATGIWASLDPVLNWWNLMETTFGAIAGAVLGFGLWVNRRHVAPLVRLETATIPCPLAWGLLGVHVVLLLGVEFGSWPAVDLVYDLGLAMGVIPIVAIAGHRGWPYALVLPITTLPIAGKTLLQLVYRETTLAPAVGWVLYLAIPLAVTIAFAAWAARGDRIILPARRFTGPTLLLVTWLFFGLNFAFFHFPWPWATWTQRTPNAMIFLGCAIGLTASVLGRARTSPTEREPEIPV